MFGRRAVRPAVADEDTAAASLTVRVGGAGLRLPLFDIRDTARHAEAARMLAAGKVAAFYLGLFTIMRVIRPPWAAPSNAELFWRVKPGRPGWSKLPLMARPREALRLIDFAPVHPAFRHLAQREAFERLWSAHGAPLHVIAPLRRPLRFLHPAFQTDPVDLAAQAADDAAAADRAVPRTTASFFWMDDPAWDAFATRLALAGPPRGYFGGSSFNAHRQQPPYALAELAPFVAARGRLEFDLVIADALFERCGAYSSHSLVRLPLTSEPPELVMVRWGSVSPAWLTESTGFPVRVLDSVSRASRRPGLSDDDLRAGLERLRAWRGG